ncbi:MAG: hypothetical protein JNM17_31675 [Archangium sp.]|nr:hypothetical protein [Archangium sp.]
MSIVIPKNELNEFSLPRVCVATGAQGQVTFEKVQFQFIPKWIAIFAMAPLLYLIFFMILRKSASGTMPFSAEGWEAVKTARRNVIFSVLGLVGACVLGGVLAGAVRDAGPILFLLLLLGGIIGIVVTSMRVRKVFPFATFIDDANVTLTLPSPEAERLISQHLSAGKK